MDRRSSRVLGALLAVVAVSALAGCDSDSDGAVKPPAEASATPTGEAPSEGSIQYVAFGDSWPEGAHCGGCESFAYLWADLIEEQTGRTVETTSFMGADEHSDVESKTSASLLASLREDDVTRDAVRAADVVLIATGPNALETVLDKVAAERCGGRDGHECIRYLGKAWAQDFNGILDEIGQLRQGHPTVVRLVNAANAFAFDPGLAAAAPKGFASTGGALIFELLTRAQCGAAEAHRAVCVDVRPLITGPNGDSDENSDASMNAVADALMDSGLRELPASGRG